MTEAENYKFERDVRFKQWQQALSRVGKMRAALVALGVTDPELLGSEVISLPYSEAREVQLTGVVYAAIDSVRQQAFDDGIPPLIVKG